MSSLASSQFLVSQQSKPIGENQAGHLSLVLPSGTKKTVVMFVLGVPQGRRIHETDSRHCRCKFFGAKLKTRDTTMHQCVYNHWYYYYRKKRGYTVNSGEWPAGRKSTKIYIASTVPQRKSIWLYGSLPEGNRVNEDRNREGCDECLSWPGCGYSRQVWSIGIQESILPWWHLFIEAYRSLYHQKTPCMYVAMG